MHLLIVHISSLKEYFKLFVHFLIGLLALLLLNFKFFVYSAYKAFVGDMICKYFLQSLTGSFLSLNTVFHREKILILMKPSLSNFFLFGTISKSLISQQWFHRFSSIISKKLTAFLNLKSMVIV